MTALVARDMPTTQSLLAEQRAHLPHHLNPSSGSTNNHHRRPSLAASKSRRSLASLAKEKTSNALANLSLISSTSPNTSEQSELRSRSSSSSLSKESFSTSSSPSRPSLSRSSSSSSPSDTESQTSTIVAATQTASAVVPAMANNNNHNKMHQSSSKILRMTDDDRPFTRDFKDLFSTLIISLPMDAHRVRFTKVDETFLSEEAIMNLGSLKFSQSNRIPDPKNPNRCVITTTTTTFSMAKEMARSVCQRFVDARLIESAEQKQFSIFPTKGAVWQLTPKGTCILKRFCDRNGTETRHIEAMIRRPQMAIVALERDSETDKLLQDKSTVEVIFRRFAGLDGPNLKTSAATADSDSISEYATGLVGVKMAKDRRIGEKIFHNTFTGKAASDWLLDCCTTIDRRETYEISELFVKHQLIAPIVEDRAFIRSTPMASHFQPTKNAIYTITEKGQRICGWIVRPQSISSEESQDGKEKTRMPKDTNMNRLNTILSDPALRLLFKEHLHFSLCEENLNFYLDAQEFIAQYHSLEARGQSARTDAIRETLAIAYGLYNSFLASGAPSELNMDHALRNKLDSRMTQTAPDEVSMQDTLRAVVELIEMASSSVFKLMATDSVPKFIRDPRYQQIFREHEFDVQGPARAMSPAPDGNVSRSATLRKKAS